MVSQRVRVEIERMRGLSFESASDYLLTVPKNIRARVVGEILDRGNAVLYTENLHRKLAEELIRRDEAERRAAFNPFHIPNYHA